MVSGLVTSPKDHDKTSSGDASRSVIALKSRNDVSCIFLLATMLLRQPTFFFILSRADMLSRQWSAKFAWFSRRVVGRKFCDPLVNFFAGKKSRVEKKYKRALLLPFLYQLRNISRHFFVVVEFHGK